MSQELPQHPQKATIEEFRYETSDGREMVGQTVPGTTGDDLKVRIFSQEEYDKRNKTH
jgi:hypothetical protein